jgi:hypothetical protein
MRPRQTVPEEDFASSSYIVVRTRLEKRFSREEIEKTPETAGFERIEFSENTRLWYCGAYKS